MSSLQSQKPTTYDGAAEKRQHPRLKVRLPVRFSLDQYSEESDYKHGYTENISASGVLLRCFGVDRTTVGRLIREGSELCMRIRLQRGEDPLPAWGHVLRAGDSGGDILLVIRFDRMDSQEVDRIHEFMLPHYPSFSS